MIAGHSSVLRTAAAIAFAVVSANAADFTIARRGEAAGCGIVIPADADSCVRYAAQELQTFTKRMTGVTLPVIDASRLVSPPPKAIILTGPTGVSPVGGGEPRSLANGQDARSPKAKPSLDGFRLCVSNDCLYVTGGGSRGVLYGVYELLERFGGCEWFTPWCENIPQRESFSVPDDLDFSDRPAFEQRETSWRHNIVGNDRYAKKLGNDAFAARMRLNGQWHKDALYGGTAMPFAKRLGICHTFYELVPPAKHFAEHPEWFSEIDGRRTGERAQLCWSNGELVKFVADEIKRRLRAEPEARMVGVSQNDWRGYCQCAECAALTKAEGSPAGPNLKFVNAVAEEVEKEFPHVLVETLAYQFTRKLPKTIRPRRNVAVCLCSFECSFSVPFAESKHRQTVGFCEDLRGWGKICRNLFIYNYATNFRNYLFPFPNVYSMAPNYRLLLENGARWIYDQADGSGYHGEFAELKCYLQSKLMWNPHRDIEPLIDRFMAAYYGAAAPFVRRYFNELYASFSICSEHNPDPDAEPSNAGIYGENLPQLTDEKLEQWTALWREAEAAVKDDPQRAYNVRMSALPVLYVRLKRLYESNYKTVWAAENLAPHIAGIETVKPLAAELVERIEEAGAAKRRVSLSENYKTRHVVLLNHFRALANNEMVPPAAGCTRAEVTTNAMIYAKYNRTWRLPIREIAVDEGAKYRVRAHIRPKAPSADAMSATLPEGCGFVAGLDVEWLPHAKGTKITKFAKEKVSSGWAWYDIGEYDISALQKIPRPTMNGLCLIVQGNVELDRMEISAAGSGAAVLDVAPGGWYHVSAQFFATNASQRLSVILRYAAADGKPCGEETVLATSGRTGDKPFRLHKVVRAPIDAVKCEIVPNGGADLVRNVRLDGSMADCRNETDGTQLINGSFEESDLDADFVDCWSIVRGRAKRTAADPHHGSYAMCMAAGSALAYAAPGAYSVAVREGEALNGHLAVRCGAVAADFTFRDRNGRRCGAEHMDFSGGPAWREHGFRLVPPPGAVAASLSISSDCGAEIDSAYLGRAPYSRERMPQPAPQIAPVARVPLVLPKSEIRPFQGVPTWFIDGEPVVNSLYTCRPRPGSDPKSLDYHREVIKRGNFPIYVVGDKMTCDEAAPAAPMGPHNPEDFFKVVDFQIRFILDVKPDARILVWFQQYPSRTFADAYPGECARVEDGDQGFRYDIPGYSYGSEAWSLYCEDSVRKFLARILSQPYGSQVVGFMPGFGNFGENNYGHLDGTRYASPHDFSPAMANFFRKWLMKEYGGDVTAFAAAWGRRGFSFAHAQAPTTLQRVPRLAGGFLDPVRQRNVIDYARCESFAILHRVDRQCRAAKEFTGGRIFTCSEIGYLSQRYHHREMMPILDSKWLDSFGPAPGYMNRGPGDDILVNAPVASLMHHGKVFLFQSDVRSHRFTPEKHRFGETLSADESVAVYRRELGKYMTTGIVPYQWTFKRWWDDPKIMAEVPKFDEWMRMSARFPRRSSAQVAVVLDPLSLSAGIEYNYSRQPVTAAQHVSFNRHLEWHRLGAPYDLWLLDDLLESGELGRYRVAVFPAQAVLTVGQRRAIREKIMRDGRTVVWMYAPGVFLAEGTRLDLSTEHASICGFELEKETAPHTLVMKPDKAAFKSVFGVDAVEERLGWSYTPLYGGFSYKIDYKNPKPMPPEVFEARFIVKETPGVKVLARYEEGSAPAAAVRKTPSCTSLFWGAGILNVSAFRAIAAAAGVHLYTDRPAVVYANENFGMVHLKDPGKVRVTLPRKASCIVDLTNGRLLARNSDSFEVDPGEKGTCLFRFEGE